MHSMKNFKLQWKDTPRPAPLGDPVATSEYNLPDPFYQGVKNLVNIAVWDASGLEHPEGHPFKLVLTYAHIEGGRTGFYRTVYDAKRAAEKLMRDLTHEAGHIRK